MTQSPHTDRRELAHRKDDGLEVTLFWTKSTNRITVEVLNSQFGQRLDFAVAGHAALDAFNHPEVYSAKRSFAQGRPSLDKRR